MLCPNCGKEIDDNSKFCSYCATKIENENIDNNEVINNTAVENEFVVIDDYISRSKSLLVIAIYFSMTLVFASILSFIVQAIYLASVGISLADLQNGLISLEGEAYDKYEIIVTIWTNTLMYIGLLIIMAFLSFKHFKNDFLKAKQKPAKTLKYIFIGSLCMFGISGLGSIIVTILITILGQFGLISSGAMAEATNQEIIIKMTTYSPLATIAMFFTTVICAPMIEEFVFRKAFFGVFQKKSLSAVFVTAAIFASIHVVSSVLSIVLEILTKTEGVGWDSALVQALYFISYFASGLGLSYIYYKSDRNIIIVTAVHMINNLVACVEILLIS